MTVHSSTRKAAAIALAYFLVAGAVSPQSGPPPPVQQSGAQQSTAPPATSAQQSTAQQSVATPATAPPVTPPQPVMPKHVSPSPALAKKALEAGRKAEASGDWQAAFNFYSQAAAYAPKDSTAAFLREFARYHVAQLHMDNAEREALAGNIENSIQEARLAVWLDPGYIVARERLGQIESLETARKQTPPIHLAGPVTLQPRGGTRTFDVRGDVRAAYLELARQFGLSVNFDPDLPNHPTRFRAPDVDFETAARILSEMTHTFWTPIDVHTMYVAEDSQAKRKQFERVVTQTFVLPNSLTDAEMAETLRVIREMTGITATSFDAASREVTLRDSPQKIEVAQKLIQEIEQGRGEVILEFEFLEVDLNEARVLGIAPPNAASVISLSQQEIQQLETSQTTQQLLSVIQTIFGSTAGGGALGGLLPPLIALGGGKTLYLSTLPSATVNYSQTFSLVRSAQRLLLRAEDAKPATFFLGTHYPITLSSLSANLQSSNFVQGALPVTNLPAAASPSALVTTSLRSNGIADLISANQGANSISVFLGNGDGTFGARTDIPVGNGPVALATADFNGDGKPDIAVVNGTDETVSIFLGNGDGTFTAGPTFATGHGPVAILAAALNTTNNSNVDLAVVNNTDNTVSIFLGDGTGNFAPASTPTLTTGVAPEAIASADFNNDGLADLAVVNQSGNTVSIFLGKGDGTFTVSATSPTFPTGNGPSGIVAADFLSVGTQDLAISNATDNTVSILLGNGDGTFQAQTTFPTGNQPVAIVTGDFNGDGILDLITANKTDNTVSVLLGSIPAPGVVQFNSLTLAVPVSTGPVALAAADFITGSLSLDLAVADQTANLISVIINTGGLSTPSLPVQTPYPGAEYEDIGVKVKATPRMHPGGDLTLELTISITSLSGSSINSIPIMTNRDYQQTILLKENQPALLSGMIDHEEDMAIAGLPGLALIPGVGLLMGTRSPTLSDTQLLILITPRVARPVPGIGRSIYAGRDSSGRGTGPNQ